MKVLFATGALLAAAIGVQAEAFAQTAKVYRYCLLESSGGWRSGGGSTLCRFDTLAQCMASKTGVSDTCIINPQLSVPRK
jgi:hypothetical protein